MLMRILILLFIQGLVSSQGDYDKFRECSNLLKNDHENDDFQEGLPNAEEILSRCPSTKNFIDCRISRFSPEYDGMYNLGDYIMIKEFLDDICDKNSRLHKTYVENFECYKSMVEEFKACSEIAPDVFLEYEASSFAHKDTDAEDPDEEGEGYEHRSFGRPRCLMQAYTSACTGVKVLEKCGSDAFDTFAEIFVGIRISTDFCGKEVDIPFMKGFLDFLTSKDKIVESAIVRTLFQVDED